MVIVNICIFIVFFNFLFFLDRFNLEEECDRLVQGFKTAIGGSEIKKTLHDLTTLVTTPSWQKSSTWLASTPYPSPIYPHPYPQIQHLRVASTIPFRYPLPYPSIPLSSWHVTCPPPLPILSPYSNPYPVIPLQCMAGKYLPPSP